jgi:tetratricopeptide (TPR) repeat protein
LLEQAEKFRERFSAEEAYEVSIRRVIWLLDERRTDEAEQILKSLKEEYADGDKREVDMLTRLARLAEQEGDLREAIELFEKASEICRNKPALQQNWLGAVLNSLGLMNRRMGKWEAAENNYRGSLDLIRATDDPIKLASAYNNLGFIVGLRSDYERALRYCRQALKLQEVLNLRYDSGRTHNTMGIIYRGKDDYLSSLEHTNQAIAIFREFKDKRWLSRAYCERGATKWHMHQLPEADADLEKSYQLSEEIGLTSVQVVILHRKGHVAWELGNVSGAEEHFNESARLAVKVHDYHQAVNNLEGLVELYYDIGEKHHKKKEFDLRDKWYEKAEEMAERWRVEYEDKGFDFPLYSGSRLRILGNISHDREEYEEALNYYLEAYPRIASRGGYSKYALTEALDWLQERIDRLPYQVALDWCDRLEALWKEKGLSEDFPEMLSVCEICRDSAKQRAQDIAGKIANNGGES